MSNPPISPQIKRSILSRASFLCCALSITSFTLSRTPCLMAVGASIDETGIKVTYYVKATANGGNNANSGLSPATSLATVREAVKRAQAPGGALLLGQGTKIYVHEGIYSDVHRIDITSESNTLLVIEGQTKDKVILTFPPNNLENTSVLRIAQTRQNVVLRKLSLLAQSASGKNYSGFSIGAYQTYEPKPAVNGRNWLFENCTFSGNDKLGAEIYHVDDITIRNCVASNNGSTGIHYIGNGADFYNVVSNNNNLRGLASFSAGGFAVFARDSVFNNIKGEGNHNSAGFRQDHVGQNLTVKYSKFNNQTGSVATRKGHGMVFETAVGPIYLQNLGIDGNAYVGLEIATSHGVELSNTTISDNVAAQVKITAKRRSANVGVERMAGDFSQAYWVGKTPINWVLNTKLTDNVLKTTKGATSYVFASAPDETHTNAPNGKNGYRYWLETQYTGINNYTYNSASTNVFETSLGIFANERTFTNRAGWEAISGEQPR